jgi:predicted rRNA methylase YqxC with S4 and FtsJ domains
VHRAVLREIVAGLATTGVRVEQVIASPLQGADGNREFLAYARPSEVRVAAAGIETAIDTAIGEPT